MESEYIPRLVENELNRKLKSSGCVLVAGPKFCGKTRMCENYAKSSVALRTTNVINLVESDPKFVLIGENPRLIDEWQKVPEIWNVIKSDLDDDYIFGKYILTGSTTPVGENKIQHSGAGRISILELKPFTLYESGESSGEVSLKSLVNSEDIGTIFDESTSLYDIAYMLCRGGWPISLMAEKEYAIDVTKNYYEGLFRIENESDDFASFLKNKDIDLLLLVLKSYARNISTQSKKTSMSQDIIASGIRKTLDEDTFSSYANILKKLFIIYEMPAWNLNIRSSATVRTTPTHHFVDTSIATSALRIGPEDLLNDLKSFGYFFEDFAIRDLSVYAQANNASLKHYRDSSGQEVDAIIEFENGEYGVIEIKITSERNIAEGIKSLNSFEEKIIKSNLRKPKFKMVLTSHGAAYKKDDVYVVPITLLKD